MVTVRGASADAHHVRRVRQALRVVLVSGASLALGAAAFALSVPVLQRAHGALDHRVPGQPVPFEEVLTGCFAALLLACTLWLCVLATATGLEAATGRASALVARATPALLRRAVLAGCGAAITATALTPPAAAGPAGAGSPADSPPRAAPMPAPDAAPDAAADAVLLRAPRTATAEASLRGLVLPDRPAAPAPAVPTRGVVPETATRSTTVTVEAGDSLWSIAAGLAPSTATPRELDLAWRTLYAANRPVVGGDPDLLLPGTVLTVPPPPLEPDRPADAPPRRKESP